MLSPLTTVPGKDTDTSLYQKFLSDINENRFVISKFNKNCKLMFKISINDELVRCCNFT